MKQEWTDIDELEDEIEILKSERDALKSSIEKLNQLIMLSALAFGEGKSDELKRFLTDADRVVRAALKQNEGGK